MLAPDEDICRSPKSYNSQVGVPLSVWELAPGRHTLGIFEAGISERGEMAKLAAIIQPTHGIFTTLGTAHDAGFASEEEKLSEKLRLFELPGFELLVYCADQPAVAAAVAARGLPALAWTRHAAPRRGPALSAEARRRGRHCRARAAGRGHGPTPPAGGNGQHPLHAAVCR